MAISELNRSVKIGAIRANADPIGPLSKRDKDALKAVVRNAPLPTSDSKIVDNYAFFVEQLSRVDLESVVDVCRGLSKLVVVDVKLTRNTDDPQGSWQPIEIPEASVKHL